MQLMLALAAALAAAPLAWSQSTTLELTYPDADDGASSAAFTNGGTELVITHAFTGSLTRMRLDTGAVSARLEVGGSPQRVVADLAGGRAVVLDSFQDRLHVVDALALTLERTISLPAFQWSEVLVVDGSDRALVISREVAVAVDTATGDVDAIIPLPPFDGVTPSAPTPRIALSPDGQSLIRAAGTAGAYFLQRVDVSTGTQLDAVTLPLTGPSQIFPSPDRSTFLMSGEGGVVRSYDTASMALRAERLVPPGTTTLRPFGVRSELGVFSDGTTIYSVPFDTSLPIVTRSQGRLGNTLAQGDDQLILSSLDGGSLLNMFTLADDPLALGPRSFQMGAFALPGADRFAVLSAARDDSLDLIARTPSGPVRLLVGVNTGFGPEIDRPLQPVPSPLRDRSLVLAEGSSNLLELETSPAAAIARELALPAPPLCAEEATLMGERRLLIGTAAGTLVIVDPVAMSIVGSAGVGGDIIEIDLASGQPVAWARVTTFTGNDELVGVDLSGTGGSVTQRIPLTGTSAFPTAVSPWRETVVIDDARQRAYAVHDFNGEIDVVALTTGQLIETIAPNGPPGPFTFPDSHTLDLSGDGSLLLRASETPGVVGIDVTGPTASVLWAESFGAPAQRFGRGFRTELTADDSAVVTVIRTTNDTGGVFGPGLAAMDPLTGALLDAIDLGASDFELLPGGEVLVATGLELQVTRFDGASWSSPRAVGLSLSIPGALEVDDASGTVLLLQREGSIFTPIPKEAAVLDLFEGRAQDLCLGGTPGQLGAPSRLDVGGSSFAGGDLRLEASGLIPGLFALAVFGDMDTAPTPITGSLGRLCLGGQLGRLSGQLQAASAAGMARFQVDTRAIPLSGGVLAVAAPGSSWTFQVWHRDFGATGAPTSNTTNAIRVEFR